MSRFFNAGSGYLSSNTDPPAIDITGSQLTIFQWFNPAVSDGSDRALLAKMIYTTNGVQYESYIQNNQYFIQIGDGGGFDLTQTSPASIIAGQWYAGCSVKDGNELRVQCNDKYGSAVSTRNIQNTGHVLGFGIRSGGGGGAFVGLMAHATIWNVGLKRDEMHRLCILKEHPLTVRPEAIRAYWPLDTVNGADQGMTGITPAEAVGPVPPRPGPDLPFVPTAARNAMEMSQVTWTGVQLFSTGILSG